MKEARAGSRDGVKRRAVRSPPPFIPQRIQTSPATAHSAGRFPRSMQLPGESPIGRAVSAVARRIFLDLRGCRACRPSRCHALRELCGRVSIHLPVGPYQRPGPKGPPSESLLCGVHASLGLVRDEGPIRSLRAIACQWAQGLLSVYQEPGSPNPEARPAIRHVAPSRGVSPAR